LQYRHQISNQSWHSQQIFLAEGNSHHTENTADIKMLSVTAVVAQVMKASSLACIYIGAHCPPFNKEMKAVYSSNTLVSTNQAIMCHEMQHETSPLQKSQTLIYSYSNLCCTVGEENFTQFQPLTSNV
jgi:hypothetical protein